MTDQCDCSTLFLMTHSPFETLVIDAGSGAPDHADVHSTSSDDIQLSIHRRLALQAVAEAVAAEPLRPDRDAVIQLAMREEAAHRLEGLFQGPHAVEQDMRNLRGIIVEHASSQAAALIELLSSVPGLEAIGGMPRYDGVNDPMPVKVRENPADRPFMGGAGACCETGDHRGDRVVRLGDD